MKIKNLSWKIEGSTMKSTPFTFETGDHIVTPRYPWYSLEKKTINGYDKYRGVLWHSSNGCDDCGAYVAGKEFKEMEVAQQDCQIHFATYIKSWIEEV